VVRHGERVDESAGAKEWKRRTRKERRFDPPLTDAGAEQAREIATILLAEHARGTITRLWTSPLARCLATAHELSLVLEVPVSVVPGLASCAAAPRRVGVENLQLLSLRQMRALCPRIDDVQREAPLDFHGACRHVLSLSDATCVLVSHREAISSLARRARCHLRGKLPYCATARFTATPSREGLGRFAWTLHDVIAPTLDIPQRQEPPDSGDDGDDKEESGPAGRRGEAELAAALAASLTMSSAASSRRRSSSAVSL